MNKIIFTTLSAFFLILVQVAAAQDTTSTEATPTTLVTTAPTNTRTTAILTQSAARKETAASNAATRKQERQETTLENLKNRALKEIDRRLEAMNGLTTRINNLKRLSDSQKSTLTTQLQTEITALTDLKTKIQADTDIDTLRSDLKSIISSYRIYALFIPKIHILTASEGLLSVTERLTNAYTALKGRVDSAKVAGDDTASMETALSLMQTKIAEATTQINTAITTVSSLSPEGYPGNTSSLKSARESLRSGRKALNEAYMAAKELQHMLRGVHLSISTTVSPTVTTSPSSTTSALH